MITPDDQAGDEARLSEWDGSGPQDESRLVRDLGALLDELSATPEVPGLDYDDIWRRIDRDID